MSQTPENNSHRYRSSRSGTNMARRKLKRSKRFRGRSKLGNARGSLKRFRQASILAVAITAMLFIFISSGDAQQTDTLPDTVAVIEEFPLEELTEDTGGIDEIGSELPEPSEVTGQAIASLRNVMKATYANLPKFGISVIIIFLAWVLVRLIDLVINASIGKWEKSHAVKAVLSIIVWLFCIGIIFSILAGDIRALIGSLGLVGLALSWALQSPIESFTGWLLNSFKGYYRVGDRIQVGDVFGDVYKIDFLNTTVWETGAPSRPGFVLAEQPTGRLVTFPNSEILAGIVINLTRDYNYVWDEIAFQFANESDLRLAMGVLQQISNELFEQQMKEPARKYSEIISKAGLEEPVPDKPQVFLSLDESWTNVVVRYLVHARQRRKWKSELTLRISEEMNKPENRDRLISAYQRHQVQFLNEYKKNI